MEKVDKEDIKRIENALDEGDVVYAMKMALHELTTPKIFSHQMMARVMLAMGQLKNKEIEQLCGGIWETLEYATPGLVVASGVKVDPHHEDNPDDDTLEDVEHAMLDVVDCLCRLEILAAVNPLAAPWRDKARALKGGEIHKNLKKVFKLCPRLTRDVRKDLEAANILGCWWW